jgi:dynein heavy chain
MFLEKHLYTGLEISWPTIKYMISQAQYGGKVTDDMDKRLLCCYAEVLFTPKIFSESFQFEPPEEDRVSKIPGDFTYRVPNFKTVVELRGYADTFPDIDNPEIYGMHPNADLTFRRKEGLALLSTLADTQPKQSGGGGGGLSREDIVYEKAGQLRERTPAEFRYDVYMRAIRKQGGLDVPMNVFLYQEVQRFAGIQKLVRDDLLAVQLAIKGEVTMTQAILVSINELFAAQVPNVWMFTITGLLFSFMLPNISLWFNALQARYDQWDSWLKNGRPRSFWMTGFYNPQGFLTAMKQEVTRAHRQQSWALDDVVYTTNVTKFRSSDAVNSRPDEGVYVHGLSIDGASWSLRDGCVVEAEPKKLFAQLPVMMSKYILLLRLSLNGLKGTAKVFFGFFQFLMCFFFLFFFSFFFQSRQPPLQPKQYASQMNLGRKVLMNAPVICTLEELICTMCL